MAYQTGNSFSVQATTGGTKKSMADYGLCLQRGNEWPFVPEPYVNTVNVPTQPGGYTYYNEPLPDTITLQCVVESTTTDALLLALDNIAAALPVGTKKRIWIDGITNRYWIGMRVNGIKGEPIGQRALEFALQIRLDDPRPYNATTNVAIG